MRNPLARAHTVSRILLLLCTPALLRAQSSPGGPESDTTASDSLYRTVAALDSTLFSAYNRCDLPTIGGLVASDLEFYHDQTGLARGRAALLNALQQNVCGKVRRDLIPGTLAVYPLRHYGAVEIGEHRFCDPHRYAHCGKDSGTAKFVMLWEEQAGGWQLTRVISYDHASSSERAQ
jgi:Domain of unknown function (DUF4440)